MQSFVDFLNHGYLPFVGRSAQLARLHQFRTDAADATGLRLLVVNGEAGTGKSRLLEEFYGGSSDDGVVLLRAKLYPESALALCPAIAEELVGQEPVRRLLRQDPEGTPGDCSAALRRLCRLRPLLLAIEDIHLLEGGPLREFASLLSALQDEPVPILCTARPLPPAVHSALEPYQTGQITLSGLTVDDLHALWLELFGAPADPDVLATLHNVTLGNSLALRSVLRGAIQSQLLARTAEGVWRLTLPLPEFSAAVSGNAHALVDGMGAHLTSQELAAAENLACLGERFSLEAAALLPGNAGGLVQNLVFKGVIQQGVSLAAPLPGSPRSAHPACTFSHTLFHKRLADRNALPDSVLLQMLAAGLPLYSMAPFQRLANLPGPVQILQADILEKALRASLAIAYAFDSTSDWELSAVVASAVRPLLHFHGDMLDEPTLLDLQATLMHNSLNMQMRRDYSEEFANLTRPYSQLAEKLAGMGQPRHMPGALNCQIVMAWRQNPKQLGAVWEKASAFFDQYPQQRFTERYVTLLSNALSASVSIPDYPLLTQVQQHFQDTLNDPRADEAFKDLLLARAGHISLLVFETPDEVAEREQLLEKLIAMPQIRPGSFAPAHAAFWSITGRYKRAYEVATQALPLLAERGAYRSVHGCQMIRLSCMAAFGYSPQKLAEFAESSSRHPDEKLHQHNRAHAAQFLFNAYALLGLWAETVPVADQFIPDHSDMPPGMQVLLAMASGHTPPSALQADDPAELAALNAFNTFLGFIADGPAAGQAGQAAAALEQLLATPLVRHWDAVTVEAAVRLLEYCDRSCGTNFAQALRRQVRGAASAVLAWFGRDSGFAFLRAALQKFGGYLDKKETEKWKSVADEKEKTIAGFFGDSSAAASHGKVFVSMLGAIRVTNAQGREVELRGERMRTLLGLLTAGEVLHTPLEPREFYALATGNTDDPERARKTTNMAVLRLREAIGHDCVLTDEGAPRLNTAVLSVDLLQAADLLKQVGIARRQNHYARALPLLIQALDIAAGAVPFPTLYDDFFEALREDFDNRLRDAVVAVAGGLLRNADPSGAESVLRRAYNAAPDDEQIGELLGQALTQLNRRAEAERIRLRTRVEEGSDM